MKINNTRWLLPCVAAVLLVALVWAIYGLKLESEPPSPRQPLSESLPKNLAGIAGQDEAIATTEEMKKKVGELLNYDDALFRVYSLPPYRISVYVAYWSSGKMSPRLVAAHTPDVCWPGNGWKRESVAETARQSALKAFKDWGFLSAEIRTFTMQGRPEYVVFWHKVGATVESYGNEYAPPWWAMFGEVFRYGLHMRKEQLFVRVSSDAPIEQILARDELAPLREALLKLGLRNSGK